MQPFWLRTFLFRNQMLGAAIRWSFPCCLRWLIVICFYPSPSWRVTDNASQPTLLHLHLRQIPRHGGAVGAGGAVDGDTAPRAGWDLQAVAVCEADSPAWTEMGCSSRKTVCFQWVLVTWGPVENITWHTRGKKKVKMWLIKTAVIVDISTREFSLQVLDYYS